MPHPIDAARTADAHTTDTARRWIVVADAARARIFAQQGSHADIHELYTLAHPESRLHPGDLATGGKGDIVESTGRASHQPDPATTPAEKHADTFAAQVADFLAHKRHLSEYAGLVLVSEASFLGRLRAKLDKATAHHVDETIDKNWTGKNPRQIQKLAPALPPE